ncbi:HAD-IC family P-type ATPase [Altererythrobacter luteolus]|uniref:HAD-IC family P-type ATPase n=1 Tax=Pontixanthobacter luteolus TaxID=295089 RepID=A0A6I4V8Y8_9SPHN|nr:HAD-IC family P-type ATPase [Pontixanthobacter luteolus]MXP48282.1 HAD-IC family P-type ATPase [Pontixanthobacter luteolus]
MDASAGLGSKASLTAFFGAQETSGAQGKRVNSRRSYARLVPFAKRGGDLMAEQAWHTLRRSTAIVSLASSKSGLEEAEAEARLAQYGPNRLPEPGRSGPIRIFARQFSNPLIYLLLGAGFLSLLVGDKWDAVFIFGVLTTNALISSYQEYKADMSARALRTLVPQTARVRRSGAAREIPSAEIVPGDIVELESGMKVTADIRLLSTSGLRVDESLLTGESMPVAKDAAANATPETPPGDRLNMVHGGTTVVEGRGFGVVVATGATTLLGEIGTTLAAASRTAVDTPLVRRMGILARQIALASCALILVLIGLLALQGQGWREMVLLAIALAVAAIPEGLPIAVTVALSAAASRMARRNVIVRSLPAVEGLGACTMIASDKTGTLTLNRLTVEQVALPDGRSVHRKQWLDGHQPEGLTAIAMAAALCNEAHLTSTGSPVGDAVDIALLDLAREAGKDPAALLSSQRLTIVPYEPALRYAAVEASIDGNRRLVVKGAPETVLPMCSNGGGANGGGASGEIAEKMAAQGYRVIVLAEGNAHQASQSIAAQLNGLRLLGFVGLADPLRYGVIEAVEKCRAAGIQVRMITGDHPATALTIAGKMGLSVDRGSVITGSQLARLEPGSAPFRDAVRSAPIYARIEPAQKLAIVQALQGGDEIVAVTGDGVNDGPALRAADIGVAMGRGGTDVARGAADLVLADDNFSTIVAGIEEGRITFLNVRKIVLFMLATGLAEIGMFLGALAAGLPMPLTPVQLLWLNFVTNGVQDVTLGFGRGEGNELQRPPRRKLAALIDREALILMVPGAIVMTFVAVWMLGTRLGAGADIGEARNDVLLMVVLFQNAFLLNVRNLQHPFWRWQRQENYWMFAGIFSALALQVGAMNFGPAQRLLGVAPVGWSTLGQCLAGALIVLLVTEAAKAWLSFSRRDSSVALTDP